MFNNTNGNFYGDKLQNQFTAYVERALKNNRVSYFRKHKDRNQTELLFASEDTLGLHMGLDDEISANTSNNHSLHPDFIRHEGLAEELRNISKKDFTIIRLRIVYGYAYKRIGALLGMKEEAVRVRYFRAIQKIRDNLGGGQK